MWNERGMQLRPLGSSDLTTAPLVFGGNVFAWTADEATSFRLLDALVDAGFNAIDTADVYSAWVPGHTGGESETTIGKWLAKSGKRDHVLIATKVGMPVGGGKGLSKAWIRTSVERSLKRLQIDTIDLYQSHQEDLATPIEETLEAFDGLIHQGKVRAIGASNYSAAGLAKALETAGRLGLHRYETLQPHYNLIEREGFERDLEPLCRERRLGVIPYFALAAGFLTGKYRSEEDLTKSPRGGGLKKYLNERGTRILAALDEVANDAGSTPAQVALAWLIARPGITAPIVSATSLHQLHDILAAVDVRLGADAIAALDRASEPVPA